MSNVGWIRGAAVVCALALVTGACGGTADGPFATVVGTSEPPVTVTTASPDSGGEQGFTVPEPSVLVIDDDPASPIAATVLFEEEGHPLDRMDFLGPKPSSNLPPTAALIYLRDREEAFQLDFDAEGRAIVLHMGEAGELRFSVAGTTMTADYVSPTGAASSETFELTAEFEQPQSTPEHLGDTAVRGVLAALRDATVDIHRAVFVHVSVYTWSTDAVAPQSLPPHLGEPFLRIAGCHADRGGVSFWCNRVVGQLIESSPSLRTYRLAMTHRAEASIPGLDPSIWPSLEACRAALGNDWWVDTGVGVSVEALSVAASKQVFTWLAADAAMAATIAALGEGLGPALLVAAAAAAGLAVGNSYGRQWAQSGETDCERIKQRVIAINTLGTTVEDIEFTIEVCMPQTEGWTFDHECQDIGPYRPFSTAMASIVGDSETLDRNQLPPVEFIATPDPGSVTGTVIEAGTGNPVAGAAVRMPQAELEAVTDAAGRFAFTEVPVGNQTLRVSADGYGGERTRVEVTSGESVVVTIRLEKTDQGEDALPWRYAGTAVLTRTIELGFGSGGSATIEPSVQIEITLHPDGTVDLFLQYPGATLTVNCAEGTVYPFEGDQPPALIGSGTHSAGSFEGRFEGASVLLAGTYTSDEIRGGWETSGTGECSGKGTYETFSKLSFGADGIPRS